MKKQVVVIGGGESGIGAALLAKINNYKVFLTDAGEIKPEFKEELIKHNIPFEEKGHDFEKLSFANLVIKSPGVPKTATVVKFFVNSKVDILSEIEFGYLHYSGKVLAITGSNGKTTASGLLYHLMQTAKYDVALGGNYGISFCRLLTMAQPEYMVLEISSFQLDDCYKFKPAVACILNITPDHLDRYNYEFDLYIKAKFRIAQAQDAQDHLVLNGDDNAISDGLHLLNDQINVIKVIADDYNNGILSKDGKPFELTLKGRHNLFNAATVVSMARIIGLTEAEIALGLSTFKNQPHRLEKVGIKNGVEFINDSKATNVDATFYALDAMDNPIVWIAGGTDKGNDYECLLPLVKEKVKALICLGVDNEKLKRFFTPHINIVLETTKVSKALNMALEIVLPGDIVLLSPASASFDLFKNYEDRGDQFKNAVNTYLMEESID